MVFVNVNLIILYIKVINMSNIYSLPKELVSIGKYGSGTFNFAPRIGKYSNLFMQIKMPTKIVGRHYDWIAIMKKVRISEADGV